MGERRRSQRALANDKAILAAAVDEIVRVGVDRVSLRDVGRVAGLTHGATYARYEDVSELLIEVWNSILHERLITMYELSREAVDRPGSRSIGELSDFIHHADSRDRAAIEMLLVSRRIPTLLEETEGFVRTYLDLKENSIDTKSRTNILFGVVMAQIFSNAQFGLDIEFQSAFEKLLIETLSSPVTRTPDNFVEKQGASDFDPLDASGRLVKDQGFKINLAHAAYEVIGRSGYVGATISRIARRSKCSPALVYKLHRSKDDLVLGAFTEWVVGRRVNGSMMDKVLDEGFLASVLHFEASDESKEQRNFCLETILAAGHSDSLGPLILGELLQGTSEQIVEEDDRTQSPVYAVRAIVAVVTSVSWLSTLTRSTHSLDMSSFAEPFRLGLERQWFPDQVDAPHTSFATA